MATKQFYAIKPFKFANRMMTAGDPVQMDGPTARLYTALNAISTKKPRAARVEAEPTPPVETPPPPVTPTPAAPTASAATRKPSPRKSTAKKRATAKK